MKYTRRSSPNRRASSPSGRKRSISPKDSVESILSSPHSITNIKLDYPMANLSTYPKKGEKQVLTNIYDIIQLQEWNKLFSGIDSELETYIKEIYEFYSFTDFNREKQRFVNMLIREKYNNNKQSYNSIKDVHIRLTDEEIKNIDYDVRESFKEFCEDYYSHIEEIIEDLKDIKYDLKSTEMNQKQMIKDERNKLQLKLLKIQLEDMIQHLNTTEELLDKALSIKFYMKMYIKDRTLLKSSSVGKKYISEYIKGIEKYLDKYRLKNNL